MHGRPTRLSSAIYRFLRTIWTRTPLGRTANAIADQLPTREKRWIAQRKRELREGHDVRRRPPDSYLKLLGAIHARLRPRTYVEIGVADGLSLATVRPQTLAIGVDPAMSIAVPIRARTKLFPLSSDEFFHDCDVRAELAGRPVDMAFIDGHHVFEQALRDFINLERFCAPESVILMHDCLPGDRETSSREQTKIHWTGDVWKIVPCLSRYRPDLLVQTLDVPPAGLTVVRHLDPSSTILLELYDKVCEEFVPLEHDDLVAAGKSVTLKQVGHDWTTVRNALGPTRIARRFRGWVTDDSLEARLIPSDHSAPTGQEVLPELAKGVFPDRAP
jgi:predicted O-methyltransferase YrrM